MSHSDNWDVLRGVNNMPASFPNLGGWTQSQAAPPKRQVEEMIARVLPFSNILKNVNEAAYDSGTNPVVIGRVNNANTMPAPASGQGW